MRAKHVLVAALLVVTSCKFAELPPIDPDAELAEDAAGPDVAMGPAEVTTDQGAHDFGPIVIGEMSPLLQATIRNTGGEATGPLSVSLLGADPGQFQIVPTGDSTDCVNARLNGGESCVAQVRYAPGVNTAAMARLEVSGNPGGTAVIPLTGDAISRANLTSTTVGHDFGDIVTNQPSTLLQVVVRNEGEQRSGTLSVTLGGAHTGDFTIVPTGLANDCAGATLDLQDTCLAQVRFQPTVAATRTANLLVMGTPGGTVTVPLTGDGLSPGNLMIEMPTGGAALDFGTRELATGATSTTQTIRIRNTGGAATGTLDVSLTGGGSSSFTTPIESCDNTTLGANATCDVQVRFNPTAVGSQPATVTVRDTVANTAASVSITGVGSARAIVTKTGQGMVVSTPTGITCASGCSSQTFSFVQTPVSLEATAESGWTFSGWTGSCMGSNPSTICSLTLDAGMENVGAAFTQVFVLMVSTTGSGTVTTPSTGILCGNGNSDCNETYPVNTTVTLTAEPDAGWEVFSWTGTGTTCAAGARSCMVTMSQARNVSVVFRRLFTLTVARSDGGDGSAGYGSVASTNVAGITCGADCMEVFFDGQSVTLDATATPAAAATLAATPWTLPAGFTCATNPCSITITQSLTATANYQIRQYDLTVTRTGNGAALGTIMRNPAGTACGTDCTRYPYGTDVMVDASAGTGASFSGWTGGGCPASGTCTADMTTNRTVSAAFTLAQYTLTVTKNGFGSGTVTGTIPPSTQVINCGSGAGCSAAINHGAMVTLTATPSAGDVFSGWSGGGCSGTAPCTTTVTAATTVTATFDNCVRSTQSCTSSMFMQCTTGGDFASHVIPNGASGSPATITYDGTYVCPMGCHATQPRCGDIEPSNGLNPVLDDAATSPSGLDLPADLTPRTVKAIDTSNFNSGSGVTVVTLDNDTAYSVPASV
ncbi:MAG TPA: choice-of-anchor D domain-containing protein, partial [Kofleriaceae bacterium]|nr:choice-of-anchor D domain-containing protein [Kofleriaceae bacterium]